MFKLFIEDTDYTNYILDNPEISGQFVEDTLIGNTPSLCLSITLDNVDKVFSPLLSKPFVIKDDDVLIGTFYVMTAPERMTEELNLELYDSMRATDDRYISTLQYPCRLKDQLDEISFITGITIDYSEILATTLQREINFWDNTLSIRTHLSMIAESTASNVFSMPNGCLKFIKLKKDVSHHITEYDVEQFDKEVMELYSISKVRFDDSVTVIEKGDDSNNVLYLTQDNMYIDSQETVDYIFSVIGGLNVFSSSNFRIASVDPTRLGDIIEFDGYFKFIMLNYKITFLNGSYNIQEINGEIKTKNLESMQAEIGDAVKIKRLKVTTDQNKAKLEIVAKEQEGLNEKYSELVLDTEKIKLDLKDTSEKVEHLDLKTIQLNMIKSGTVLNRDVSDITLSAQVVKDAQDITSTLDVISFTWQRKSGNSVADEEWNELHKHFKQITLTYDDVISTASFQVKVTTPTYTKYSGYETIVIESSLKVRLDANLPLYQHYAKGVLDPSWNPLLITPEVKDGVLSIPLEECEIAWRRADGDLQTGEVIEDGVLKVTQNKLSEVSTKSITYICTVKNKNFISLDSISFTFIIDGESGKGIVSITNEYYLSTSKEAQEGGEWTSTAPVWSSGKYIWTRTKSIFTDETISYTNPICDTTWEAVNDLEDKVNDKIDKDISSSEQRITETYESALNLTKEEIGLTVSKLEENLGNTTEIIKGVQNQLEITSEATSFIKTTVDKLTDVVDGKVDEATIKEWARFDGSSLELGSSNSPFKAILSNTELAFWQGNTKVAWISNNELHIAHAVVMETLRIGSFQMQHIRGTGLVLNRWE
ncbi:hypothetical protein ACWG0P_14105 [Amedibacillus sp. YH-ame6]